ncbi:MAG: Uma2 family endonuclease [Saprospiraceae bacterium]
MPTASLAQQLLERPDAVLQMQAVHNALAEEKIRRHDFYEWVTEGIKAEFINGEIIVHSPVKRRHWMITDLLSSIMSIYVRIKKIGVVGTEKVMIALTRNDYEPDLVFFSKEKADRFTAEQVLFPAPDFVVEILSKSTAKIDRTIKKADYAAHGVREYWIIDPDKQRIEQYILSHDDTEYFPAKIYQLHDTITSIAVAGFEIPVNAIFDEAANVAALQRIMAG